MFFSFKERNNKLISSSVWLGFKLFKKLCDCFPKSPIFRCLFVRFFFLVVRRFWRHEPILPFNPPTLLRKTRTVHHARLPAPSFFPSKTKIWQCSCISTKENCLLKECYDLVLHNSFWNSTFLISRHCNPSSLGFILNLIFFIVKFSLQWFFVFFFKSNVSIKKVSSQSMANKCLCAKFELFFEFNILFSNKTWMIWNSFIILKKKFKEKNKKFEKKRIMKNKPK